jgi:hypothetical protein
MHDDEKRIVNLTSDELRQLAELRAKDIQRTVEVMAPLSPYDVARWFDVPPHLLTYPELTDGER